MKKDTAATATATTAKADKAEYAAFLKWKAGQAASIEPVTMVADGKRDGKFLVKQGKNFIAVVYDLDTLKAFLAK